MKPHPRYILQNLQTGSEGAYFGALAVGPSDGDFVDTQSHAAGQVKNLDVKAPAVDEGACEDTLRRRASENLESALGVADARHGEKLDNEVQALSADFPVEGLMHHNLRVGHRPAADCHRRAVHRSAAGREAGAGSRQQWLAHRRGR